MSSKTPTRKPRTTTTTGSTRALRSVPEPTSEPCPLTAADQPQAPPPLRQALRTLDHHVDDYINHARLTPAA